MSGWAWQGLEREPIAGSRQITLTAPCGRKAGTIYQRTHASTWSVWDPDGTGGQNDVCSSVGGARWALIHAAKVRWYEQGWASPIEDQPAPFAAAMSLSELREELDTAASAISAAAEAVERLEEA